MALSNLAELQAAIARTLRRSDLAAEIPDFITLAEGHMNRRLRVRSMIARATAELTGEYSGLPGGFLGVRTFAVEGAPRRALQFVTPDRMEELAKGERGAPGCYSIVGAQFRYHPAPEAAVTASLTYWQAIPPLAEPSGSNWVLETCPDAYLYGALTVAAPFLKSDERLAVWGGLFAAALDSIEAADRGESFAAALTAVPSTQPF